VGKEIFIKSVAQSAPIYYMSVFFLPSSLEDELQKRMNSFWWGSNRQMRKDINWLSWNKLVMKMEFGGMGSRNLHIFILLY